MEATIGTLLSGYRSACARFDAARRQLDEGAGFNALFDALNSAASIDEAIGQRWAPEGKPLRWSWRKRVPGAEVMRGLRFARHRVHHNWAAALRISRAEAWYPPREFEFQWKPLEELPGADQEDDYGREEYRVLLANRPADVALSLIDEVFDQVWRILEMPGSPVGLASPFFEPNRDEDDQTNQTVIVAPSS